MKKIILVLLLLVLSQHSFAEKRAFTCALNRSFYIDLIPANDSPDFPNRYTVFHRHFENEINQHLVTLDDPDVINLGDVLMIFQNFGKTGHIFIRIEGINSKSKDEYLTSYLDINLFPLADNQFPKGYLFKTFCFEREGN